MAYTLIKNGVARPEKASSLYAILNKYSDMYKFAIYIGGQMVFVVEKTEQPHEWEHGWAE